MTAVTERMKTSISKLIPSIHRFLKKDVYTKILKVQNRLLKVCYVPGTSAILSRLLFLFLRWPLTVLMKQTRQAVRAFKQSVLLRCLCVYAFIGSDISIKSLKRKT